jgi:hypothetical protein
VILEGADGGVLAYAVMQCDRAAVAAREAVVSRVKVGASFGGASFWGKGARGCAGGVGDVGWRT